MSGPPPPSPPPSPPPYPLMPPPPPPPPLPPPPDLHTLVALAASLQIEYSYLPVKLWRLDRPDKPRALDAIAALCVDPENPRPVAVALTIDARILQVRLLISHDGADRLDARLLGHLRKTWGLLRTLSQTHFNSTRQIGQMAGVGPVFRYAYQVHQVELLRVFREWWPKLDAAHRTVGRRLRHRKPDLLTNRFMSVALALRMAVRIMGDDLSLLTQKQWVQLLWYMDHASTRVRILFQMWKDCEDWGIDFQDTYSRSAVRCALENLTSLHRHLDVLTVFARFARPVNFFSHSLHVSFLPLSSRPIQLPLDWKPTLLSFGTLRESFNDWCTKQVGGLTTTYSTPQHCAPHPECALIMHLHSERGGLTPALGYIGLSAPTCAACDFWMEAYRKRKMMRFRYRGGSNVWCWPWAFTRGVDEAALVKGVLECCSSYFLERGAFRSPPSYYSPPSTMLIDRPLRLPLWELKETCVFGCDWGMRGRDCRCVAVLWGEPQEEGEKQDDDDDDDDDYDFDDDDF